MTTAAQANESIYTNEQTLYQSQTSALNSISGLLTSLQVSSQTLQDPAGPLAARDANSSNSNVVTATASSGISTGSYSVVVNNLASTSTWVAGSPSGQTLASGDTVYGSSGNITIQVGTNSLSVPVQGAGATGGETDTLNTLAAYINSSAQNPGVTATVITDATGSQLALTSNSTGAAGEITVTGSGVDSNGDPTVPGLTFTEPVPGQNASATINGVTVHSASNVVAGVIPGVTFNLAGLNTSAAPATVSVTQDSTQASAAINSFVSAYNAVIQAVNTQFTYTAGGTQPPLFSDSALQQVQTTLANDVNFFTSGNNGISGLSSIGVNLQQDGTLSVDSAALTSALSANPAAVQNLFQGPDYMSGLAGKFYNDLNSLTDPTQGVIALDLQGISSETQDVTQILADFNANLILQQQQWTTEYSQVNATLQQLPLLLQQAGAELNTGTSSSSSSSLA